METETYRLDEVEIVGAMPWVCEWFGNCDNSPTHLTWHPVLDWVAVCDRCLAKVEGK